MVNWVDVLVNSVYHRKVARPRTGSRFSRIRVDSLDEIQPLGRHLILLFDAFERDLLDGLHAKGFGDITRADLEQLRYIRPEGSRAADVSRLAGVTKQAVGKAMGSLQARGYVSRASDAADSRAKVIEFTPAGRRLIRAAIGIIERMERRYAELLGERELGDLKAKLRTLFADHQRSWP